MFFKFPMTIRANQLAFTSFADETIPFACIPEHGQIEFFASPVAMVKFQSPKAFRIAAPLAFTAEHFDEASFAFTSK